MNLNIVEAVSDLDREFFEAHPWTLCRLRPFVPGEVPSSYNRCTHVIVVEMFPGGRMRLPIEVLQARYEPVRELVQLDTGERWSVAENGQILPARGTRRPIWEVLGTEHVNDALKAGFAVRRKGGRW